MQSNKRHVTQPCVCPHCDYKLDRAANVMSAIGGPSEGDFSVCAKCAEILVFTADLTIRAPSSAERARAMQMREVQIIQAAIRSIG